MMPKPNLYGKDIALAVPVSEITYTDGSKERTIISDDSWKIIDRDLYVLQKFIMALPLITACNSHGWASTAKL